MFFNTINKADAIRQTLQELKFPVNMIIAETDSTTRRGIIGAFSAAEFSILINVNCISEGVNIPCIDTVIFMEPRGSNIGVIQNVGRGLRLHKDKDFCMVLVDEQMLEQKFIENLYVYDQRLNQPANMIITEKTTSIPKEKEIKYSVEGIAKLIEIYDSKNRTQNFINRLKSFNIRSKTDYMNCGIELTKTPELDYKGFTWESLIDCHNPYDNEMCIERVKELIKTEREKLEQIGEKKDRLIYLYKIDNRINPELFEAIKDIPGIKFILNPSGFRRSIK
jgi:superfamily II DNA or RNA helicase